MMTGVRHTPIHYACELRAWTFGLDAYKGTDRDMIKINMPAIVESPFQPIFLLVD